MTATASNDQIILDNVLRQRRAEVAPTLPESEFFEVFVAEQVLKDLDLSYDEIQSGIVGSGGDGGVDAVYIYANGELVQEDFDFAPLKKNVVIDVYIMQAKLSPKFGETPIDKLILASEDLFNLANSLDSYRAVYNEDLLAAVALFRRLYEGLAARFPRLCFHYVYASRGDEIHPNVQRKADLLKSKVCALFSAATVEFDFYGAKELLERARRAPKTSYTLSLAETPISSAGDVGFVCLVKLKDYNRFITSDNGLLRKSLFEANVRDYQGATQVNEEIRESLAQKGREDFWWLNNGVTIIAAKAEHSGKKLTIDDPQIVNGLQTSTEVFQYFRDRNTEGDERNLLVRVIVPAQVASRDRIIKATNSQTAIPPASLRATDKIHRDIEEYLKPQGFLYDRRKNSHKNDGKPLDQIVSISLMAQAVMAILLQRPEVARGRPSSLLKSDDDYKKMFAPDMPIEVYLTCIKTLKLVDAHLRNVESLTAKHRNNVRFYVAMHLVASVLGGSPNISSVSRLDFGAVTTATVQRSFETVWRVYGELGETDQVAKGGVFRTKVLEAVVGAQR